MKRMKRVLLFAVLCMVVFLVLPGNANAKTVKKVKSLTIKEYKKAGITLGIGEAKQLHKTYKPSNINKKKLKWQSSKASIVSVTKDGKIKAKKVGTAKISILAKDGSKKKASVTIKVIKKVEKVTISNASTIKEIENNSSVKINTVILPTSASNKSLVWKSSNTKIATVSQKGVVLAKKAGTAEISAVPKYGKKNVKAKLKVNVKEPVASISLQYKTSDEKRLEDYKMKCYNNYTIIATITPKNADLSKVNFTSGKLGVKFTNRKEKVNKENAQVSVTVNSTQDGPIKITAASKDKNKKSASKTFNFLKVYFNSENYKFVAHRGYTYVGPNEFVPENTIEALENAYSKGFRMVELDVYRTASDKGEPNKGEYVVAHDNRFEEFYTGDVIKDTLANDNADGAIKALIGNIPLYTSGSAVNFFDQHPIIQNVNKPSGQTLITTFAKEKNFHIPTLKAYLEKVKDLNSKDPKNPMEVFIEFKQGIKVNDDGTTSKYSITSDDAKVMTDLVKECGVEKYVYYTSFEKKDLEIMRLQENIPGDRLEITIPDKCSQNFIDEAVAACKKYGYVLGCPEGLVTRELVENLHKDSNGKSCKISAWTTNGFYKTEELIGMGVDYLTTDGYTSENYKYRDNPPWNVMNNKQ